MIKLNVKNKVLDTSLTKCTCDFFGYESHKGVDLVPKSTDETPYVLAYGDGEVIFTQNFRGTDWHTATEAMGTAIAIKHKDKTITRYQHLKYGSILVKKGEKVKKGQKIALYGRPTTGNSSGSHLHWDMSFPSRPNCVYKSGGFMGETRYYVNPVPYLENGKIGDYKVIGDVNIRTGAGTSYSIVGELKAGEKCHIYETKDKWGRISEKTWVHLNFLTRL